jgi:hypothetical protein
MNMTIGDASETETAGVSPELIYYVVDHDVLVTHPQTYLFALSLSLYILSLTIY